MPLNDIKRLTLIDDLIAWCTRDDWMAHPRRLLMIWYPEYKPMTSVALYAFTYDISHGY